MAQEGFGAVARVCCQEAAFELAVKLGGPMPFQKFPRTEHLVDLGAATNDDLVLTRSPSASLAGDIVIEEKVDGGCMGISLDSKLSILVQNRSRLHNFKDTCAVCKAGNVD